MASDAERIVALEAENEALRRREAQMRAILNGISANIAFVDRDLIIQWANRTAAQSVGQTPTALIGKKCHALWADPDKPCEHCPTVRAFETGQSASKVMHTPDGRVWDEAGEPVYDDHGHLLGVVELAVDITAERRIEEALRDSEDKYRYLFDHMNEGVFYQAADGRLTDVNAACLEMMGLSRDEFLSRTSEHEAWRVMREDGSEPTPAEHPSMVALATGEPVRDQVLAVFNEQKQDWVWYSISAIPQYRDDEETPFRAFVTLHDITARKQATEQLLQAQKMEAIGRLAGGVAHDMNNMLASIVGFASLIRMEFAPDNAIAADARQILEICQQARQLTDSLLAFARKGKYRRERVDLNAAARRVADLLSRTVSRRIRIRTDLAEALPTVEGDPGQLEQALMNLCLNAVHALGEEGEMRIQTSLIPPADEAGPQVELIVYDSGVGMEAEVLAHACEPFFTTKPAGEGSGLGLSMVYGAVEHHGGTLRLFSQPGEGTRISIRLPAQEGAGRSAAAAQAVSPASAPASGQSCLLVVDDEEMVRKATGRILGKMGYRTLFAADGQEALAVYTERREEVDLILLDMGMPRMDGAETFKRLRALDPGVRVLVLSGYSADDQSAELLGSGVLGFLQKPILPEELRTQIDRALQVDRE